MEDNQKLEDLLNLSLSVPEAERMQSEELSAGFDAQENVWTLIIKYHGDIEGIREIVLSAVPLFGGYAVVKVRTGDIAALAASLQVEYIEKPKMLYFEWESVGMPQSGCLRYAPLRIKKRKHLR